MKKEREKGGEEKEVGGGGEREGERIGCLM